MVWRSFFLFVAAASYDLQIKDNISIPLPPGFTALSQHLPGKLVVSSFEATPFIGRNGVFMADVGKTSGLAEELPGTNKLNWPNSLTVVNESVFGFTAIALGDGFLVPSHTTGGVYIMEASPKPETLKLPVKITEDKSGWFYHQAEFLDVDGDGLEDVITARCEYSVFPWIKKQGELVWLKHPAKDALSGEPWQENPMGPGPDFLFCMKPGKTFALVAPEYISGKVVYWYMKDGKLSTRILDMSIGPGFSCSWEDLNNDGHLDLLVTNHRVTNGSVFAYTFSSSEVETAIVTRHVLATGFTPSKVKTGNASPGDAVAFRPKIKDETKPWIFVSGDNSNSIFMLTPKSEAADDWSYVTKKVADVGVDVGRPSIADVDLDGFADIFVPLYNAKKVAHYTFTSAQSEIQI